MFQKLEEVVERFKEVEGLLADSAVLADRDSFLALTREHAELSEIVAAFSRYKKTCEEIEGLRELLQDADNEVRNMAKAELPELEAGQGKFGEKNSKACFSLKIRMMKKISFSRSGPAPAGRKRLFLLPISTVCTAATPKN